MHTISAKSLSAYESGSDAEEILKQQDGYILALARKKVLRTGVHTDVLDLEIDELAQNSRIKLWLALQKTQIINLKAYIRCIVHTEAVNLVRQRKDTLPLLEDIEDELTYANVMVMPGEGMQDPSWELEQKELFMEQISRITDAVVELPPRQREAMICSLKDEIDDLLQLLRAFRHHQIDIEAVNWPGEKIAKQRLKASLSFTRKKLRPLMNRSVLL
jgi:DNA-directed RNA polymerase specialized sigma24 family protein